MKLKQLYRTSTLAWAPASEPLLATGTVAGALDESFSDESQLEIWAPDFRDKNEFELGGPQQGGPKGVVKDTARFNKLAWGSVDAAHPSGIIAAGLENGELALWDPAKILAAVDDALILRNSKHTGPIRGLDFNPLQSNLFASGGVSGEVYIWDLNTPAKPYTPTLDPRSNKLDELTAVAWNRQVQHVLAGSSNSGNTVVWDLRGKREVVALAYGAGGAGGMSDIKWHPDNATRLVTALEDDQSPIIMLWDLRNARAPEKILTGHEKGILSLSWCAQDADLLLSCGKDNRTICWNPQSGEALGELRRANNWAFQVEWCPRNPDLLAAAFFDGTIGIHSLQGTNESAAESAAEVAAHAATGADIFDLQPGGTASNPAGTLSLSHPPKWFRRPVSASFGFAGKLVSVSNLPAATGKHQSGSVHLRTVHVEEDVVERAKGLREALTKDNVAEWAREQASDSEGWKALLSLFNTDSREELVALLGFEKSEIERKVREAVESLAISTTDADTTMKEEELELPVREAVVSFAETDEGSEKAASEVSAATSVSVSGTSQTAPTISESESTTTVPSLFGEEDAEAGDGGASDFFSTVVPHTNYQLDSSVAATAGSRPSSVASEPTKSAGAFNIYPTSASPTDRLITQALVLGDFESAVSLCLASSRYADAILLAVRGGPALLRRTQEAYFASTLSQQGGNGGSGRVLQAVVNSDLGDIVRNADVNEWKEVFVVLCTFVGREKGEFEGLVEELGGRLEEQGKAIAEEGEETEAKVWRKNATLAYLAAGKLERLVGIWAEELVEEEAKLLEAGDAGVTAYSARARALQAFVEKVSVFRAATKYLDADLQATTAEAEKTYKLAGLYERYYEYAAVLAGQGLIDEAVRFLELTPAPYGTEDVKAHRDRLVKASSKVPAPAPVVAATRSTAAPVTRNAYTTFQPAQPVAPSGPYGQQQNGPYGLSTAASAYPAPGANAYAANPNPSGYPAPAPAATGPYAPPPAAAPSGPYAPPAQSNAAQGRSAYTPLQNVNVGPAFGQVAGITPYNPNGNAAPAPGPPPPRTNSLGATAPPPMPPPKRAVGGWNDAPAFVANSRATPVGNKSAAAPITSPFANMPPGSPGFTGPASPYLNQGQPQSIPPPPRPGSVQGRMNMPPPPPMGRPASTTQPPPSRMMSPPQGGPPRLPTPSQYAPPPRGPTPSQYAPPPRGPTPSQQAPSGPYAPPPQQQQSGPYAPPPQQQQSGPYAPPPQQQQTGPYAPPPQAQAPSGPYAPPPQQQGQAPPPPGPYGPPPGSQARPGHQGFSGLPPPAGGPPPPPGGPAAAAPRAAPPPKGPPPPKYPPGDRSHIPETSMPAYQVISGQLEHLRQTTPPQQKRLVEDLERRINPLFDALNCETLSAPVVEQLLVLTRAMENHDRQAALAIHVDLLTRGSQTDDIGMWMSGVKQLIMRLQG
ncbi:Nucleoporin-interacting protein [Mycena kentingensis (nom. inval.)]|nr:Nucleoporin-interacting protein [Mycena kentingensis (nom. inval.)]